MSRIVVALGGNALGNSPKEQLNAVQHAVIPIVSLIKQGNEVVISHGNGPQVGMIQKAINFAADQNTEIAHVGLPECTAMSQGYIGYHLQQCLISELRRQNISQSVATIVTQVEVLQSDEAFENPSKPIGAFYPVEVAKSMMKEDPKLLMKLDANRGYRQYVASPKPIDIVEKNTILQLLNQNFIVVACGGGGIPVIQSKQGYQGISAVIDKDFASEKLAELVKADYLFILTAVDQVAIYFNTDMQQPLGKISVSEMEKYVNEGHFAIGSMLPKVTSAIEFAKSQSGRKAIIASLKNADLALVGQSGTEISL